MKSLEKDVFKRCGLEARAAIKDSEGAQPRDGGEPSPAGNRSQATARERGDCPPVGWPRLEGQATLGWQGSRSTNVSEMQPQLQPPVNVFHWSSPWFLNLRQTFVLGRTKSHR